MGFKAKACIFFAITVLSAGNVGYSISATENGGSKYLSVKNSENNEINPDVELDKLNKLIDRGVKNADIYYNRAWLYALKGAVENAKNDYTHAIELDNGHADAYFNRGLILLNEGLHKEAVSDFSKAIDIKPEVADTYCNRGNAYFFMGKALLALKDYNRAIEISGDDPDLYYNRAMINQALGRTKEAKADFSMVSGLREKSEVGGQRSVTE